MNSKPASWGRNVEISLPILMGRHLNCPGKEVDLGGDFVALLPFLTLAFAYTCAPEREEYERLIKMNM